ncbi:MAG: toll/interleukin-1 receptor domain-containing protein [Verrucomicrobia bacterium]|nr:toll/interleukin-1 receptor domain-containing protein [Verrucomicrobiota bacterium]
MNQNSPALCPQCSQLLTQAGKHWIGPEHDIWFDKNEIKFGDEWWRSVPLAHRIALSHPMGEGLRVRVRGSGEGSGVRANSASQRVVSFLSKHSTRDAGVCRDEIAIAIGVKGGNIQTILVESEQEVQPPVNIGHIQWLDMHDSPKWDKPDHRNAPRVVRKLAFQLASRLPDATCRRYMTD